MLEELGFEVTILPVDHDGHISLKELEEAMQKLQTKGLTEMTRDRWRLTERGWLVSNQIILYLQELQERSTPITKAR